jgi:hypothetical protein
MGQTLAVVALSDPGDSSQGLEKLGHFTFGVAVTHFARDLYPLGQDRAGFVRSSTLGQGLTFLKIGGDVFRMPVNHGLILREASFEVSLVDAGLGQRVLQKHVVWIGFQQLFKLSGRRQV